MVLVGRKLDKLFDAAAEIAADGGRASFHSCDIRDEEAVKNTVQAVIAVHGRIDALVNNAGGQYIAPLEAITGKGWDAVLATNLERRFPDGARMLPAIDARRTAAPSSTWWPTSGARCRTWATAAPRVRAW